jgi:hypothetical protein
MEHNLFLELKLGYVLNSIICFTNSMIELLYSGVYGVELKNGIGAVQTPAGRCRGDEACSAQRRRLPHARACEVARGWAGFSMRSIGHSGYVRPEACRPDWLVFALGLLSLSITFQYFLLRSNTQIYACIYIIVYTCIHT